MFFLAMTKCTTEVDRNHPTWQAIDAQYAKLADAMKKKDIDALFALYMPDFHAVTTGGQTWTREQSLEYQRNGLARVEQTSHISNTIVRLVACGDHATATVLQQWYRTQTMAGKVHKVETNAVQDEDWTRTPDGWKRGDIHEVRNGAAFVDEKRVDSTKPYDPDAPAFDPYHVAAAAHIRAQYDVLERASASRDVDAMLAVRDPRLEVFGPNGQHDDFARMAEYTRQWFVTNKPPIEVHFTIESIDFLAPDEAAVHVLQRASRVQVIDGKERHVEHEVRQRETWVRTPDGWKLRKVDEIDLAHRKRWVDGVLTQP